REVYGRMDISVATTEGEHTAPPSEAPPPSAEPSPANRGPQRCRAGTSLPTGPDPAMVFKYMKLGGFAIIGLLLFWIVKALFFDGGPATPAVPPGPTFGLVATSPVQVTVRAKNPDGSEGEFLYSGIVTPGETKTVSRPGAVFIEA